MEPRNKFAPDLFRELSFIQDTSFSLRLLSCVALIEPREDRRDLFVSCEKSEDISTLEDKELFLTL